MGDDASGVWNLYTSYEDPFVHFSAEHQAPVHLISWAYVELVSPVTQTVQATLVANGPTDVWVEGAHLYGQRTFAQPVPSEMAFPMPLDVGPNRLLIRFEQLGYGPTPYLLAVRLSNGQGVTLQLPSHTSAPDKLLELETLFGLACLDRDLFTSDANIAIRWPADLHEQANALGIPPDAGILLRLQKPDGRIYAETRGSPRPGELTETVPGHHVLTGTYQAVLMPPPEAYAIDRVRTRRVFDVDVFSTPVVESVGSNEESAYVKRLYQGVQMAMRLKIGLLSPLAAMTLGAWRFVDADSMREHIQTVQLGAIDRERQLLALLGIRVRFSQDPAFPDGLIDDIDAAFATLPSILSTPADEVATCLRGTLEILSGQVYPEYKELHASAEGAMQDWLFTKGRYGLRTLTDDGDALDTLLFSLSHLADLAAESLTRELAAVLLDKILFTVAINTFRGIGPNGLHGTMTSLARVLWGTGVLSPHLWAIVGLANARAYPIPPLMADIVHVLAREDLEPFVQEEHHLDPEGTWACDRILYRTPESVLTSTVCSEAGNLSGMWQAVLGPEAVVSVNHPVHAGRAELEGLGFWRGDRTVPHLVQRGDSLLAQYDVLENDPMGFTHARFPLYAFDEHLLCNGWAFARKGKAYVAVTASSPVSVPTVGPGAYRELRAGNGFTTWVCQLGTAEEDGDFVRFQKAVQALPLMFGMQSVRWSTLRGETLTLDWEGGLTLDSDKPGASPGEPSTRLHYATPYCTVGFPAEHMDIRLDDTMLRLDFST